jgi:hypothetical protein
MQLVTSTPDRSGLFTKANFRHNYPTRVILPFARLIRSNVLHFISRQGATLTADLLTNRLNRRLMAFPSHGRNTMKTDSQDYKGRSFALHTIRIACMRNQSVDEYGAIVLGPMNKTQITMTGRIGVITMPFPTAIPIKAGSK